MLTRQSAVWVVCVLGALGFAGAVLDPFHQTVQAAASPVLTYSQSIAEWRVTDGFIYLSDSCRDGTTETRSYVQRRAINGQSLTSLSDVNQKPACRTFRHLAADASGVYYYNRNLGRLEAIYSDAPTDPPTALATIGDWTRIGSGDGISALRLDANNVYWIETVYNGEFSPNDVSIKRVSKRGGVPKTLFSYSTASQQSFRGLGVTSKYIWWTDSNGLNRINSCTTSPCAPGVPLVKTLEHAVSSGDGVIHISGSNVLWWNEDEEPKQIRLTKCHRFTGSCSTTPFHTSGSGNTISGLAANSSEAYWVENVANVGSRLLRKPLGGGAAEILIENIRSAAPHLDVDGVYFQTSTTTISRLPFDAAAITREIGLAGWEVTQGVQRLANDVPLVAGKTTYVRLYPTLEDGADVGAATAALHGSRDGEALPGSPIYPLNIAIPIRSNRSLADRAFVSGGWLFRLPESWTRTGSELIPQVDTTISMRGVIDPNGAYSGSDRADNNEITGDFSFVAKAPTCVTMRSVVTNNAYQSTFGINVGQVLELTESILPTPKLIAFPKNDPLREIKWCWKKLVYGPFCSTPYELSHDDTNLLTKMGWIDFWADSPSVCFNNNARTLLAGIVHDDAEWDWAGLARTGKDQLLTKVPRYGAPTAITRRNGTAMTMVHEIGHSYDRGHIDCGGPKGPDRNYPYPTDKMDFNLPLSSPELHFGFDPLLRVPVIPSVTADYMSYCSPEWYSDYTWKALFNKTRDPVFVPPVRLMSAGGDMVRIAGLVDTIAVEGTLDPAWTLPIEASSEEQRQRWEAELTAAWDGSPDVGPYHVQLVGEDGRVLLDQRVELSETEDGDPADLVPFALALTAPVESVARMQLMANDTVLDSRSLGTAPPVVAIDQQIGGTTIDREILVSWTASDPDGDRLSHTIQYSPNGMEWHPLLVNYEGTGAISESMTLDLSSEAGSAGNSARIRVLTSDGFNTAVALSPAFSVAKRGPVLAITHPTAGQTFAAESSIPLRGFATDPEDGLIADDQFVWSTGQTGQTTEIAGLAPGLHALELTAADSDGLDSTNAISFTVAPLFVPATDASLVLDGYCDDAAYAEAVELPLTRYADGSRPSARVLHTSSGLWLCLTDLHEIDGRVGLLVDSDHSREESVQIGDFGYFVDRDGTSSVRQGNGGDLDWADPSKLAARISDSGAVWSAELRIQRSAFESFQKRVSLAVGHFASTGGEAAIWPREATMLSPRTWGQANLGLMPVLTAVAPEGAVLGEGDIELTVSGAGFTAGNVVRWNGTAVSTTLVDAITLTAQVPADLASAAGAYRVTVGVEGVDGLSTAATRFIVSNPRPVITGLLPDTAEEGATAALVTIDGTGFVEGATVVWAGEPRTTTYLGPTQLSTSLTTAELAFSRTVAVLVDNPQPSVGPSNVVEFTIAPAATPTPTQTPTAVATLTPTQTSTVVPTATPSQTPTAVATAVPTQTSTAVSTPTMTPTQQPTAIATPTPTRTPTAVASPTPPARARIHLPWLSKP